MAQFHALTVTALRKTTRDAVEVTFAAPEGFTFEPGQYLTFRRAFDGEELRRSYSICAAEGEALRVGIKQVAGGAFSTWANTQLQVGDVVEAMPPMGRFYAPEDAPHLLCLAAGSGITPILSIIATVLERDTQARVTLVYANRTPASIMFRDEIEDLKNRHMGRLSVVHVLSGDGQEIDLFRGRIDAAKVDALVAGWIDLPRVTTAYICGPEQMMQTVSARLEHHGMDPARIRFELFAAAQPGRAPRRAAAEGATDTGASGQVTFEGETRSLTIPPGTSLLDAALAASVDAPYACKAGVCSTCKARVTAGEVEMVANHALEDYEVEAGFVLTCQCYPTTAAPVTWNYDEAGH